MTSLNHPSEDEMRLTPAGDRSQTVSSSEEVAAADDAAILRPFFDAAPDAIVVVNSEGQIVRVNPQAEVLFDYPEEEMLGQPVELLIPRRFHHRHVYQRRMYLASPHSRAMGSGLDLFGQRKDGSEFPVDVLLSPVRVGDQFLVMSVIRDVSERKAAEAQRRLFEPFRLLVDNVQDYAITILNPAGQIMTWNRGAERITGYRAEEIIGQHFSRFYTPEDIQNGMPAEMLRQAASFGRAVDEGWRVRKDRSRYWAFVAMTALRDDSGELRGFAKISRDLTERRQAEERLRRLAERLQIVHELDLAVLRASGPDAVVSSALKHIFRLVPCDRASLALFDFAAGEWFWLGREGLAPPETPIGVRFPFETFGKPDLESLQHGKPYQVEDLYALAAVPPCIEPFRQLGLRAYLRLPLITSSGLIGSLNLGRNRPGAFSPEELAIGQEIANQLAIALEQARLREELQAHAAELEQRVARRTAQLQETNSELEAFAYSVSHDLRAPLRAMEGFSQALLEDYANCLDAVGQDYARRIMEAAKRMDRLINDLLDYSRLSRAELTYQPVSLGAAVREACEQLEAEIADRKARIDVAEPLPAVLAHPGTLTRVIANLISNGIKFTERGTEPRVKVWAESRNPDILLYVEDNGIGIAPEHQERIFRILERLHGQESYPGTGIGLALVRKGVERMGGKVGLDSAPSKGSRFWIELPAAEKNFEP